MKTSALPLDTSNSDRDDNTSNDEDTDNLNNDVGAHSDRGNSNSSDIIHDKMEEDLVSKTFSTTASNTENAASVKLLCTFENATFTDITLDKEGKPAGDWSWPWNKMPSKNGLRCVAGAFDVTGPQAKREDEIIKPIIDDHNVQDHHDMVGGTSSSTAKGLQQIKHCTF